MGGKAAGKIVGVGIAAFCRYFADAEFCAEDQLARSLQTIYFEIVQRGQTDRFFKFAAQMSSGIPKPLAQVSGAEVALEILLNVRSNVVDYVGFCFVCHCYQTTVENFAEQLIDHRNCSYGVLVEAVTQCIDAADDVLIVRDIVHDRSFFVQHRQQLLTNIGAIIECAYIKIQHIVMHSVIAGGTAMRRLRRDKHKLTRGDGSGTSSDHHMHTAFLYV